MIVGVTSNPVTITAAGGDIDVPSPQNMTTWRSGSYQAITWKEKDPQNPVASKFSYLILLFFDYIRAKFYIIRTQRHRLC